MSLMTPQSPRPKSQPLVVSSTYSTHPSPAAPANLRLASLSRSPKAAHYLPPRSSVRNHRSPTPLVPCEKQTTACRRESMSWPTSSKSHLSTIEETYHRHPLSAPRSHPEAPASIAARHPAYHHSVTRTRHPRVVASAAATDGASLGRVTKSDWTAEAHGAVTQMTARAAVASRNQLAAVKTAVRAKRKDDQCRGRAQACPRLGMWRSSRNRKSPSVEAVGDDVSWVNMNDCFIIVCWIVSNIFHLGWSWMTTSAGPTANKLSCLRL